MLDRLTKRHVLIPSSFLVGIAVFFFVWSLRDGGTSSSGVRTVGHGSNANNDPSLCRLLDELGDASFSTETVVAHLMNIMSDPLDSGAIGPLSSSSPLNLTTPFARNAQGDVSFILLNGGNPKFKPFEPALEILDAFMFIEPVGGTIHRTLSEEAKATAVVAAVHSLHLGQGRAGGGGASSVSSLLPAGKSCSASEWCSTTTVLVGKYGNDPLRVDIWPLSGMPFDAAAIVVVWFTKPEGANQRTQGKESALLRVSDYGTPKVFLADRIKPVFTSKKINRFTMLPAALLDNPALDLVPASLGLKELSAAEYKRFESWLKEKLDSYHAVGCKEVLEQTLHESHGMITTIQRESDAGKRGQRSWIPKGKIDVVRLPWELPTRGERLPAWWSPSSQTWTLVEHLFAVAKGTVGNSG